MNLAEAMYILADKAASSGHATYDDMESGAEAFIADSMETIECAYIRVQNAYNEHLGVDIPSSIGVENE